jgi:hypothetical protein
MNRKYLQLLLVVLVSLTATMSLRPAVGQTETSADAPAEAEVDVTKLTPEKLAEQFSVEWTNISAQAQRNLKRAQTQRSIQISAQVTLVNEEHILFLSNGAEVSEAIDGANWMTNSATKRGGLTSGTIRFLIACQTRRPGSAN